MIDFFTGIYPSTRKFKKNIFYKLRVYSLIRFLVRSLANLILPFYFKLNNYCIKKHRITCSNKSDLIVSFTSFPARIDRLWLVVESIFRQKYKPDKLILWLSKEQFASLDSLPKSLLKQQQRGLEIKLVDGDIRSYKKYYYTLKSYPNSDFIIIDDDVFYTSDFIFNLVENHNKHKGSIVFNRGHRLVFNKSNVLPYTDWQPLLESEGPSINIFATGVGGVYYPANSLHHEALNVKAFTEYCPQADDVWLYVATRLKGTSLFKSNEVRLFLPVLNKNNETLSSVNVNEGRNDQQIQQVRKYLICHYSDIFNPHSIHEK